MRGAAFAIAVATAAALALSGCGKKGNPKPPVETTEERPTEE